MKIIIAPSPELRQVCEPVDLDASSLRRTAAQMEKTMYKNNGCGLAGPQVGILKRIIVMDCEYDADADDERVPIVLLNPQIVEASDEMVTGGEGCLSVPGVTFQIDRHAHVVVRAYDLDGVEMEYEGGDDLFGRCLQHEIDHLDGITMFERLKPIDRITALQEYREALARGAKPGDVGAE